MRFLSPALALLLVLLSLPGAHAATPVPDDEENPRFLLAGQADQAVAEERYDDAAARLLEAIGICPDCPDNSLLLSNLGMVYAYAGRDSLALSTLDEALRLSPALTTARSNRARLLLKMGRDRQAYDDFGIILSRDSLDCDARYYHGMLALYSGHADIAEADFTVIRDSLPMSDDTARALSALYVRTGRESQAIPYLLRLTENEPAAEYFATLAGCYLANGKLSDASETLGKAFAQFPDDPELYYYRAWLNRDLFRTAEAHRDARQAVSLGFPKAKADALFKR